MQTTASDQTLQREEPLSNVARIAVATRILWREPELRALLACCIVLGLAASFVVPFQSMFGTLEVGMTLSVFGVFMTLTAAFNVAISTVLAWRSDTRYSRRTMLLMSSACGALGYCGYAFLRELWQLLLVGSLLLGVASLSFSQLFAHARELLSRSNVAEKEIPLYINTFRMSFALAWTVGPALAAAVLHHLSFVGLFLVASGLHLLLFLLVLLGVRAPAGGALNAQQPLPENEKRAELMRLLSAPTLLAWFVAFILMFAAHTISMSNMSLLVLKVLSGDESEVGIIFSLAPLFELPLMLYIGVLAIRVDSNILIRFAMMLAIVYYACLSLVGKPWHIYPLQLLSAAIVSVTSGIAITFFQNKLPGQFGSATNLYATAQRIGSTSGYLLFGVVASRFGHRGAYVASACLAATALFLTRPNARRARAKSAATS